jgi:hypothetical protein
MRGSPLAEHPSLLMIFSGQGGDVYSLHRWAHAHRVRVSMIKLCKGNRKKRGHENVPFFILAFLSC